MAIGIVNSIKLCLVAMLFVIPAGVYASDPPAVLTLAFLHMKPEVGEMAANTAWITQAMTVAADYSVDWVLTPELALTGYYFTKKIGTDWIVENDPWVEQLKQSAARHKQVLFLSHVEKLTGSPNLYNSLFVIDQDGELLGAHHKINTIPISEAWSTKGDKATVLTVGARKVGLLICADAWPAQHAKNLAEQGAELIVSTANWGPGKHGPQDTWEQRSEETGLPVFVNNRTGKEGTLDMAAAI